MFKNLRKRVIVLPLGLFLLTAAGFVIWKLPQLQVEPLQNVTDPNFANHKERIAAETAARIVLVQGLGGLFVAITALIAWRNLILAREKQAAERFSKAVEQLGNEDSIYIRLAAIAELAQIAGDAQEKYYWQVMETLTAYVRERAKRLEETEQKECLSWRAIIYEESPSLPDFGNPGIPTPFTPSVASNRADIQAVFTVLGNRKYSYKQGENDRLNLRETDLRGLVLRNDFRGVCFEKANLQGADLRTACFQKSIFNEAKLFEAVLNEADFREASLKKTDLQKAVLYRTNFGRADLLGAFLQASDAPEANFQNARLRNAHLRGANLQKAIFRQADLTDSKLRKSDLRNADLQEAQLSGATPIAAELEGANFARADLRGTRFIQADLRFVEGLLLNQLDQAVYEKNLLPDHLQQQQQRLSKGQDKSPEQKAESSQVSEGESEPPQSEE